MRPSSEGPGRGGTGRRIARRTRLAGVITALLAAVLLAAGCSSSSSNSSSGSTGSSSAAATSAAASGTGSAPDTTGASPVASAAGTDVGLTATTIRVAMIADVNNPLVPGLFQDSVNAVKEWANDVNASGGLAGRKVVVDF